MPSKETVGNAHGLASKGPKPGSKYSSKFNNIGTHLERARMNENTEE